MSEATGHEGKGHPGPPCIPLNGMAEHGPRFTTYTHPDGGGVMLYSLERSDDYDVAHAEARLANAARDLLAAARDMLVVWEGVAHPALAYRDGSPAARLRAAIAKAEGRP